MADLLPHTLQQQDVEATGRRLSNPDVRLPLPVDFPPVMSAHYTYYLQQRLEEELAKHGETLQTVKRLTVAFPHKDPDLFPRHYNAAEYIAKALVRGLYGATPKLDIQLADGICETQHLARSENQSVLHALTKRQAYHFNAGSQTGPLDFMAADAEENGPHYFVLADNQVEQGTTLANLASYIRHNGGQVLFAACNRGVGRLVPEAFKGVATPTRGARLSTLFAASACADNLRLIGDALVVSAVAQGVSISRNGALNEVETHLRGCGMSLAALTHVEARRLYDSLGNGAVTYAEIAGRAAANNDAAVSVARKVAR